VSNPIYNYKDSTFTLIQMVGGWNCATPSSSVNTNPCLTPSASSTPTGGPDVGMLYGLSSFNTTYFEVYSCDIKNIGFRPLFLQWQNAIKNICVTTTTGLEKTGIVPKFTIYPNPLSGSSMLEIISEDGSSFKDHKFKLYDIYGREIRTYDLSDAKTEVSGLGLANGIYFYRISYKDQFISSGKLIIE
jgi:hypothetical protein